MCQSLPADIWLVVVDASDDRTPDRVRQHRPSRTRVVCEPSNVVEARQIGAYLAETKWLLKRRGYTVCFDRELVVYARDHRQLDQGRLRRPYTR